MNGTDVDQIPIVDAVMSPEIKVVQFFVRSGVVFLLRACLSMMLQAPARTSWILLSSSFSISSGVIVMNSLPSAKTWPMRTPMNSSDSPLVGVLK
jgi:hypothetical protein